MGGGDQQKGNMCGQCGKGWETLSKKYACCEKNYKKISGTKKGGIARSGATVSGSQSEPVQNESQQEDGSKQPEAKGKGKESAGSAQ